MSYNGSHFIIVSFCVRGSRFKPFHPSPPFRAFPRPSPDEASSRPLSFPLRHILPSFPPGQTGFRFGFERASISLSDPFFLPNRSLFFLGSRRCGTCDHNARVHFDVQAHVARCLRSFRRDEEEDGGRMGTATHHEPMQPPGNQDRRTRKRPGRTVGDDATMNRRNTSYETCNDGCRRNERQLAGWNVEFECKMGG